MILDVKPYKENKELLRMLTDPIKKEEYEIDSGLGQELIYQMSLKSAIEYLNVIWKMLHGLPLSYPPIDNDLEVTRFFYQHSDLWFRDNDTPVDSSLFIGRFLSEIALYLADNLDTIVTDYVIHTTKDIKMSSKVDMLDQIVLCFVELAKNMICGKKFIIENDKLFEMFTMCTRGGMKRRTSIIRIYNDQICMLRDITKNGLFGIDFMIEDSIIINNIILLAYIMVTEDYKAKDMFKMKPDITFSDEIEVKNIIRKLGMKILTYKDSIMDGKRKRRNKDQILAALYEIYIDCKPKLNLKYKEIGSDIYLAEGCLALSYLGYMSQSDSVYQILRKMIYK